uniref:Uncharacterized protein n=1 Tax=Plectus sambesii TaxID=2011161 RepID=A0A914W1A5_9BILA
MGNIPFQQFRIPHPHLLPIAHSTISGLESLAYVSSCPENLLNVHIRAIPLENRIATPESHQKPSIEPRLLDLDEHPPLPLPSISSSAMPETITNHQRIADSWSYGLDFETYGGCLRRNLTFNQPSIMGFA